MLLLESIGSLLRSGAFLPPFCIGLFPFTSNFVSDSVLNPAQSLTSYLVIVWLSSPVMCIYNSRHGKLRQENHLRWKTALKLSKNGDKLLISALFQTKGAKMRELTHLAVNNALFTPPSRSKICAHSRTYKEITP